MPPSEILVHDLDSDAPVRLADESSMVVSSAGAGWSGLVLEHQHLPAAETPEGYMPWHLLSVQLAPPPAFEDQRDGPVRLAPDDVIFRPAGVPTRAMWTGPSETLNVSIDPATVVEAAGGAVALLDSRYGADPVVRHLALALRAGLAEGAERLFADGIRNALVARLLAVYAGAPPRTGSRRLSRAELARVRERILDGLSEDLRLADVAAVVPLSPFHFSRVFKATTGLTPHSYVMRCRVEAARSLLARGDLGLDEVAARTGFADGAHLARRFRREFGMTPSAFRAAAQR